MALCVFTSKKGALRVHIKPGVSSPSTTVVYPECDELLRSFHPRQYLRTDATNTCIGRPEPSALTTRRATVRGSSLAPADASISSRGTPLSVIKQCFGHKGPKGTLTSHKSNKRVDQRYIDFYDVHGGLVEHWSAFLAPCLLNSGDAHRDIPLWQELSKSEAKSDGVGKKVPTLGLEPKSGISYLLLAVLFDRLL